jgi:hypothetical protein
MVRPEIIRKRLNKLDEYLAVLRKLQGYDLHPSAGRRSSAVRIQDLDSDGNSFIREIRAIRAEYDVVSAFWKDRGLLL